MTDIFLFIPDAALREAVTEQIAAAKLGAARHFDSEAALLKQMPADLVIIDQDGKIQDSAKLAGALQKRDPKPVILLLGDAAEEDGVSETFAKPLRLGHLITRLRYYLETAPLLRDRLVSFGPYRLEPQNRRLLRDGAAEPIRLTEKETALLVFLAQNDHAASRRDILAAVWGYDERIDTRTLETHIYQLRRKLDDSDQWLLHENGAYRLAGIKP